MGISLLRNSLFFILQLSTALLWGSSDLHALGDKLHDSEHCSLCIFADQGMEASSETTLQDTPVTVENLFPLYEPFIRNTRILTISTRAPPLFSFSMTC